MDEPVAMEVFVRNIPYTADEIQVTRALATVLHGPSFKSFMGGAPFNFIVRLIKGKAARQRKHSGCAIVLVPSQAIGSRLILVATETEVSLQGRRLHFAVAKGQNPAREDVAVLAEPYQDPAELEEEQNRRAELAAVGITVTSVSFGWPCNKNVVSLELELGRGAITSWSFTFATDPIRVKLRSTENLYIWIHLRAIQSIALDENICMMWLERPPVFEQGASGTEAALEAILSGIFEPHRERIQAPTSASRGLAGLLSVLCITFRNRTSKAEFQRRARMVGLTTLQSAHKVERRGLFSPDVMKLYDEWITTLPFEVAFQVEGLVTRHHFSPRELVGIHQEINLAIKKYGVPTTASCIQYLEYTREEDEEASIIQLFLQLIENRNQYRGRWSLKDIRSNRELFECHHVTITPTSVILNGPFPDESNRVIRKYIDHQQCFLRVQFREEDRLQLRLDRGVDTNKILDERFSDILRKGITVAGRKFEFLGYSSSALKEHAVWFMTKFIVDGKVITPDLIRESLGDFKKVRNCPARYGARIAQAFSATEDGTLEVPDEIIYENDKKSPTGSLYTDGVGRLSKEMAEEIWEHYTERKPERLRRRSQTPSAFQIRLGGAKGMLCVDPRLEGRVVTIRGSMNKFQSDDRQIEISRAFDRPTPMYLNRPLVMLLETLNVGLEPFMDLQRVAVQETRSAATSIESAARLLEKYGLGTAYKMTSVLLQLQKLKVDLHSQESDHVVPFLKRMLSFAVNHILRDMKYRARVPVPDAWTLVGVSDEWGYLNEGEIFAYVCTRDGRKEYIKGPVLISRSPTVHPGDARMVQAIGEPPEDAPRGLRELTNCVVFPCAGERSLPDMLAGGDLDGDIYCLIKDERLHPKSEYPPGNYDPLPRVELDRPSDGKDVADFVINYIKNDILGIIATQHLLTADIGPLCMADPDCIQLARFHSHAVDFPKSGHRVDADSLPRVRSTARPDWYANENGDINGSRVYRSQRIIGHLFRDIQLPAPPQAGKLGRRQLRRVERDENQNLKVKEVYKCFSDDNNTISRLLRLRLEEYVDVQAFEQGDITTLIEQMLDIYQFYWEDLAYICQAHSLRRSTPISEEEVVASTIAQRCSQPRKRQDLITSIRRDTTTTCDMTRESIEGPEEISKEDRILRAWVAWKVSVAYKHAYAATSFGLISLEVIFRIMRQIDALDL